MCIVVLFIYFVRLDYIQIGIEAVEALSSVYDGYGSIFVVRKG